MKGGLYLLGGVGGASGARGAEVLEVMRRMLLSILEAVNGELCLLDELEVMRCMLLCTLLRRVGALCGRVGRPCSAGGDALCALCPQRIGFLLEYGPV